MRNILIYCVSGEGWVSVDGKRSVISENQFCFIPKYRAHTYAASGKDPWTIYWIHFSGEKAGMFVKDELALHTLVNTGDNVTEERIRLFEEIFYTLESEYSDHNLEYAGIVLIHLLGSFRYEEQFCSRMDIRYADFVSMATTYMKNHLHQKVSSLEIASHCKVSLSHFCLLFKKSTSHTPMEYLNNLRIQSACKLLDFSTYKISEISEKTGFSDPFYFSRVFKKSIGQSPKEYRKQKSG